jgi:urease subunit alpha
MPFQMDRKDYASLYGPTKGDKVRLADTNLFAEVEEDYTSYGDELLIGFGKTIREGMQATGRAGNDSKLDLIVTNAVVIDPVLGIFKGNIGIKDGRIVGIGSAGNPDIVDNVDLVIGTSTSVLPAEGLIATPGGVDSHVHLSTPAIVATAISSGITTLVGMGSGGVFDVGVNPAYNLERMLEAWETIPLNIALLGRGSTVHEDALMRNIEAGAAGLKIHEDFAAFPEVIDRCLSVAEAMDVPVAMHTDSLNESAELEDTLEALRGRTVHAYHVEGSGGGHVPNLIEIVSFSHALTSSTNPTLPYSINAPLEQFDMIMTVHRMSYALEADVAAARSRVRASTIAAETVLHDLGAIAMVSSDSLGMGRVGEVISRTWQIAHRMKEVNGNPKGNENERILRYIAKYTINPAITHGLAHEIGSLEPGKWADIVLWHPAFFGVKPQAVIKGGYVVWAPMGDGNAATRVAQPQIYRPMWGSYGAAPASLCISFVSRQSLEAGLARRLGTRRRLTAIASTRRLSRSDMVRNTACPTVKVDPETYDVYIDGRKVELEPAYTLPLSQRYFAL